jgi:phage shock protein E
MKHWLVLLTFTGIAHANPAIDMPGYLQVSREAAEHRASRLLPEEEFIRMSREPGTVVLDARSREKFHEFHVRDAISLPFSDIAIESLKAAIPDQATRILIYCNNNFANAEGPFPAKIARASLNLSTYIALYSYGYRNVYELEPLIDLRASKLPFEGSLSR